MRACDRALDAKKKEVSICQLGLQQSQADTQFLSKELADRDAKLGSVFRNPFVMISVGVILGVLANGLAHR